MAILFSSFHPIEIFFQTFYPMAILFSTFQPIEIFFQTFYPMAILFFLLFIWQPKIEAQKYEIGTPIAGPLSLLTCAQGSQLTVVPLWS